MKTSSFLYKFLRQIYQPLPEGMKKVIRHFHSGIVDKAAGKKIREASLKCKTIDDYLDLAFSFAPYGMFLNPLQKRWEIKQLMKLLLKIRPKVACEIGTAGGGTLYLLSKMCSPEATIISIDLPAYPPSRDIFFQSLVLPTQKLYLIRGNSHDFKTLEKVKEVLNGRSIDFLLIDGDHSYEGVKSDFKIYNQLVKTRGIVVFHDIAPPSVETDCEVHRFWQEIKDKFDHREIVEDWKQGTYGFGLIFKDKVDYYGKS